MDGIEDIAERLSLEKIKGEIWINGSFLTGKIDPNDADMVACLQSSFVNNASLEQMNALGWFASNLKGSHLCDSYLFIEFPHGDPQYEDGVFMRDYWMKQFSFSRSKQSKGIAVIGLP